MMLMLAGDCYVLDVCRGVVSSCEFMILVVTVGFGNVMSNWEIRVKTGQKVGKSYGMELPRVGAFTEKWGS